MGTSVCWMRWTAIAIAGSVAGCAVEAGQDGSGLAGAGAVAKHAAALEESVALPAIADTTVKALTPNQNFGTGAVLDVNRTLVRFDQTALRAAIGASDHLLGARLELQISRNKLRPGAAARAVSAFRLNKNWTETGATWNCAVDTNTGNSRPDCSGATAWSMGVLPPNPWATPASASATIAPGQTSVSFDVTADVRGYLSGAVANQGWVMQSGPLGVLADFAEFASRQTTNPPRLILSLRRCSASLCDDGNACTADSCDAQAQCVNAAVPDGSSCDDGDECTGGDQCLEGACSPGAMDLCAPPMVVLNEAESNQGVPGDWVELYNAGTTDADISGWVFKDNDDAHVYVLPGGSVIPPGGYLVLDELNGTTPGFDFGLGMNESVRLFDPNGNLIDSQSWGPHAATTYGRCPNGAGMFTTMTSVTKGAANDCSIPIPPVVINEAESDGGVPGDWVELFNLGTSPVDLAGFVFKDADDTHVYALPAGSSTIAAGGYLVLEVADFVFGLGQPETVRLFTPDGKLVDSQSWTTHAPGTTYGRCPNGSSNFTVTNAVTKGAANDCGSIAFPAVVINEAESNGGVPGDWVELYNAGTDDADISGWVFKDNDDTHVFALPAGSVIAAGGYLVLEEAAFGFGLGMNESVRLFDSSGAILIDSQSWGPHASTTYGRCPNGSGAFTTMTTVTKGAANDCSVPLPPLPPVVINEAEGMDGVPGDWVELFNRGTTAVDLAGFVFKDADDTHVYTLPAGSSTIAAGGYLLLEEAAFGFGLGQPETVRLFAPDGRLVDSQSWMTHAPTTSHGRCPNGIGAFALTASVTKGAANDCGFVAPPVVINEAESDMGVPGDWVELYNAGTASVDLAGFVFKDNDDTHAYTLPAGSSTIPAGGYLVLEVADFVFGLGANESVRLFAPDGMQLIDSQSWTEHATTTHGRCPSGTGGFAQQVTTTKGAENDCGQVRFVAWPGGSEITPVDLAATFSSNLSGLTYQPATATEPAVLWAAQNGPGTIYKLLWDGSAWVPSASDGWGSGKRVTYPDGVLGTGGPDCEGLTKAEWDSPVMYVATERNNDANSVSRLSVLRVDTSAAGTLLVATREWNLTADVVPGVGPNLGFEAITYIPDDYLVGNGFIDESMNAPYDPLQYGDHGGGVFFVGVEATGKIYGYVLDHASGGFQRVAEIDSGHVGVMGLEFDRDMGGLWAHCDNGCSNRSTVLAIETDPLLSTAGRFVVQAAFERPATMPATMNNEGIAIAPESECVDGLKSVFWTDDGDTGGNSLRTGTLSCEPLF